MVMDTNHPFLFQGFACALSTKTKGVAEWLKAHQVAFKATASNQSLRVRLKHQNERGGRVVEGAPGRL